MRKITILKNQYLLFKLAKWFGYLSKIVNECQFFWKENKWNNNDSKNNNQTMCAQLMSKLIKRKFNEFVKKNKQIKHSALGVLTVSSEYGSCYLQTPIHHCELAQTGQFYRSIRFY